MKQKKNPYKILGYVFKDSTDTKFLSISVCNSSRTTHRVSVDRCRPTHHTSQGAAPGRGPLSKDGTRSHQAESYPTVFFYLFVYFPLCHAALISGCQVLCSLTVLTQVQMPKVPPSLQDSAAPASP